MLNVSIGDFKINRIVLLSPQPLTYAILGLDYHGVINFAQRSITLKINGEYKLGGRGESSSEDQFCSFGIVSGVPRKRPPLWSSGQSFWLQIQRSRVRSPALPDFLSSSGSGTGSTQPREVS